MFHYFFFIQIEPSVKIIASLFDSPIRIRGPCCETESMFVNALDIEASISKKQRSTTEERKIDRIFKLGDYISSWEEKKAIRYILELLNEEGKM